MPKFFRVCRGAGQVGDGMYCDSRGIRDAPGYITLWERHPLPRDDTALDWGDIEYRIGVDELDLFFGFSSKAQLRSWIYNAEWREYLASVGFEVRMWDLPEGSMHSGDTQAVADCYMLVHMPFAVVSWDDLQD